MYLLKVLFEAICSSGRPVLLAIDNLHSAGSFVVDMITELTKGTPGMSSRKHLFLVGACETEQHDSIMNKFEGVLQVTSLQMNEPGKGDLAKPLSRLLRLPPRYINRLAEAVYRKTRGCQSRVVKFLKFVIQAKLLSFDEESRQWIYDIDLIENQRIDDVVASLMVEALDLLPKSLMKTLQIVSCITGSQIEASTLSALNTGKILPFDIHREIRLAVQEGLLDEAGGQAGTTRYSFSHGIIKQALYDRIPKSNRQLLHKTIGNNLLKVAGDDPSIYLLATDQLNLYCKDNDAIDSEESSKYAGINITAANKAIAASRLELGKKTFFRIKLSTR